MDPFKLKTEERDVVRSSFLFQNAAEGTLAGALDDPLTEVREFARGEVVYDPERFERAVGLVLTGRIRVSGGGTPRYRMRTLTKGDPFGAATVFSPDDGYVTRLTAETRTRVLFLPQKVLARLLYEDPAVAENYIVFLSGRVRFLNEKIRLLTDPTTEDALLDFLAENAVKTEDGYAVRLTRGYSALADALNMGRASLYRALDGLESAGLLSREGKIIRIPDPEALKKMRAG